MKFVSLATDAAPTYAVWAPVAARVWQHHGYRVFCLVDALGWETPFGRTVLDELSHAEVTEIFHVGRPPTLSVANAMRCSRLVAAAAYLDDDDFLLATDVDILPIRKDFFCRSETFVALRAMFDVWQGFRTQGRPAIDVSLIEPGVFRLPMCYAGATAAIWRELFPVVPGDPTASLHRLVEGYDDRVDLDETLLSRAFLGSPRAAGSTVLVDEAGTWRKGELILVDPMTAPLLSVYPNMPRGMMQLDGFWIPGTRPPPPEAIDFIPQRFTPGAAAWPWDSFHAVAILFPWIADWLWSYRSRLERVL